MPHDARNAGPAPPAIASARRIGEQCGDRIRLFLETEDYDADHVHMLAEGVRFETQPRDEPYRGMAVWGDPWGNRWDLTEFARPERSGTGDNKNPRRRL